MKRREKARRIGEILDDIFPTPRIPLDHKDPYTLLVSTVLSAQCTDVRVNTTAPVLFARADTPEGMIRIPVEVIQGLIRPCGLSEAKAKAISGLSRMLVENHGGRVPRTFAELEALPGVGHKTASVVMSQAFGLPAFPVDTHIHRLARRWGLSSGASVQRTERDLKELFAKEDWHKRHLQMIYFGRTHCPARGHDFEQCPICSWAASEKTRQTEGKTRRIGQAASKR